MKSLIALVMLLVSFTISAETSANAGKKCLKKATRDYIKNGNPSDYPIALSFEKLLPAGEALLGFQGKEIAKFEEDRLIYSISGSYHSGYFTDLSVVNVQTCETEEIINIYSE